jgi:hypothetical protein
MTLKFIIIGLRVNEDRVVGVELKMSPQRELKNVVEQSREGASLRDTVSHTF